MPGVSSGRHASAALLVLLPVACALQTGGLGGAATTGTGGHAGGASASASTGSTGGPRCGDGVQQAPEGCDGTDFGGATCASLGFSGGPLACTSDCTVDETGCVAWYALGWKKRRLITIDHTKVTGPLTAFPVALVSIDASLLGALAPGGADVVVTGADAINKLEVEVEEADATTLVVWVSVPALSSTADTTLYLYYGNPAAAAAAPTDAASVWGGEQAVWHLGEATTSGKDGTPHADSTGNGHTGTQNGNGSAVGKLGRGQTFDGNADYIDVAAPSTIVLGTSACTISAWIKTASTNAQGIVLKANPSQHESNDHSFGVSKGGDQKLGLDEGNVGFIEGTHPLTDGQWHHVAWTQAVGASSESWDLWVDGAHEAGPSMMNAQPDVATHAVRIGWNNGGSYFGGFFSGVIDEVRISGAVRTPAWLSTSYANQNDPASFATFGPEETAPAP
jgi:Concanavalin A-like lectin/glucanases superfamily/Domain of unknown function (DUF2341)